MKTWCVAVLLSLVSVCRAAPLTCDKLLTPGGDQDLAGRWYLHAMSSDSCLLSTITHTLLKPSLTVNLTPKEAPNIYDVAIAAKLFGLCKNVSETFFYEKSKLTAVHSTDYFPRSPYKLLSSGCSDCLVMKVDSVNALALYSRRRAVGAAELKEFESHAACLKYPRPQLFDTDYDFTNCSNAKSDPSEEEITTIRDRIEKAHSELLTCMSRFLWYALKEAV